MCTELSARHPDGDKFQSLPKGADAGQSTDWLPGEQLMHPTPFDECAVHVYYNGGWWLSRVIIAPDFKFSQCCLELNAKI